MTSIFESKSHFEYLKERFQSGSAERGEKTRFSQSLRIQPAYLSQILARKYSLSLEQAELANQFFDHSTEESEFFLLLVSRDRAGTVSLKKHFDAQMNAILKKRLQVVERLGRKVEISAEAKGIYYSSWIYSAIHISCTIPELRTRKALAQQFSLPLELVGKVLDFMVENSLLAKEGDEYLPTQTWIRLDRESPHIARHHTNWRQKAVQNLEVQTDEDLHYSGIYSMDLKTAAQIKDRFLDFIKAQIKEIEAAPEKELFVIGIDFFNPIKKIAD